MGWEIDCQLGQASAFCRLNLSPSWPHCRLLVLCCRSCGLGRKPWGAANKTFSTCESVSTCWCHGRTHTCSGALHHNHLVTELVAAYSTVGFCISESDAEQIWHKLAKLGETSICALKHYIVAPFQHLRDNCIWH